MNDIDFGSGGPIDHYLADLYARMRANTDGAIATYIPELAKADPEAFGIAVATVDGKVYTAGDADQFFTIQSISKAFIYGHALAQYGRPAVLSHVGVEPTGEAFNSIVLDDVHNRPFNPMVNAGAMATAELIKGEPPEAQIATMLEVMSRYAGRSLDVDEAVFRSEQATGHRNRAIAYMMLQYGHDPQRAGDGARHLFPPVLGARHLSRPGHDGGDACQRRRQSGHRRSKRCRATTSTTC